MPKLLSVFGLALVLALAPAAAHAAQQGYLKTEGAKQGRSKGSGTKSKALPSSNGSHQQSTPTSTATHHK
jgi:hypothetical protein